MKVAELDRDCTDHQESRCIDIFDQCQAKHFEEKQINEVLKNEEEQCFACNRTFAIEKSEPISTNPRTVEEFRLQIRREFVEGSAIDPELYSQVRIVADTEVLPGGDVETPIHDALNWKATRFGHQSRPTLFAALLLQESGECWQAKLSNPRKEAKGKTQKYETPVGNGSRTFLPEIPASIRRRIGTRYGVEVPLDVPFWNWVEQQTEVEIIFTEGAKKALSLLSQGYIAIALYGVNGGYSNVSEIRSLTADVQRFAKSKRPITLAFDQDAEAGTRSRVNAALIRFGGLLKQSGCDVSIAVWDGSQGKGADDLIANCGTEAFDHVEVLALDHWQMWQRLENPLTYPASIQLKTSDLSTFKLDHAPETGITALISFKATGKTNFITSVTASSNKVLAVGHRISLMQNLCKRAGLDYRGDLDRANGQFINKSGYSLRIGFCVDSILSIDPETFVGCDLIIDEVVQVVRHLLTSSTCAKDGKRPALLARLRQLVRVARRVIIADADLDNATLHYIRELRGDDAPVFLIRNDYQPEGYAVQWINTPDRSAIIAQLCDEIAVLPPGKVMFVVTDSKALSKSLAQIIGEHQVLLVNSQTSGGEEERDFITNPDKTLEQNKQRWGIKAIVCSPSLATGVSIEAQDIIAKVYGIFTGASLNDADIAQSLMRVREPVDRVIWCANRGSNFSKVSRSTNPIEIKDHLQQRTSAAVSLVRSSLREDTINTMNATDWQSDPHINLYCQIAAQQNRSMYNLASALMVRLKHEGHTITIEERGKNKAVQQALISIANGIKRGDAQELVAAADYSYVEVAALEQKEGITSEERLAIAKFHLKDFYCLDELTIEDVLADEGGRRRGELLSLEAQIHSGVAFDRTARALEKQMAWNSGNCPWDISIAELRRVMREKIGLNDFLTLNRSAWTKYDLKPYADRARQWAAQIKLLLNFSITPLMSDVQIVHQLLSQMGISIASKWSRSHPGHEGEKLHLYSLDVKAWQPMIDILERRKARREGLQAAWNAAETFGSPPRKGILTRGGDPKPAHPQTQEDSGVDADEAFSAKSCANLSKQHRRAKQNFL